MDKYVKVCSLFLCCLIVLYSVPSHAFASASFSNAEKLQLMTQYAPQVWFDKDEQYYPSSVEWSFSFLERYKKSGTDEYSLRTKESLDNPNGVLSFFHGNLNSARVYSFWKQVNPTTADIKYYIWYPYNRGKISKNLESFASFFGIHGGIGNHVGDWEGISIRLENGQPTRTEINYHSWSKMYDWKDIPKVDASHVVTYSAQGSHGMWKDPGEHEYYQIKVPVLGKIDGLVDKTSKGKAWNTWNALEAYDMDQKQGLSGKKWPTWMSADTKSTLPGKNPADPMSGGIASWGNEKKGCDSLLNKVSGECTLSNGPSGPDENSNWSSSYGVNSKISDFMMGESFGGNGGGSFNDLSKMSSQNDVKKIILRTGSRVDQIGVQYTDGLTLRHGGSGGGEKALELGSNEWISQTTFCKGNTIHYAKIVTNQGRTVSGGNSTNECRVFKAPSGFKIAGFWGSSGSELDRVGAVMVPNK
ncbi:jacalin-like lectin [Marininema halotolerans]|uniref:Jacalin-like lectin domain-containing protein n=1 Tax=Marininema halotolerans TaxID=1155944 RepID=A0A1I6UGH2_9BACL|nr:Vps62-related protein [Marininema halotolerans]SFT00474.1 Jacalin-like lectin domain-containing protein [Marininema halotolerans]